MYERWACELYSIYIYIRYRYTVYRYGYRYILYVCLCKVVVLPSAFIMNGLLVYMTPANV